MMPRQALLVRPRGDERAPLQSRRLEHRNDRRRPAIPSHKGDQARWCVGIALDPKRGHVYWTQKGGDNAGQGMIRRAAMKMPAGATAANRPDIETLFSNMPEPIDLDLDLALAHDLLDRPGR